jgi:electron transfer flavoprotein alpha subunit
MKALLIGEYREGKLLASTYELVAFARKLGAETAMFLVGGEADLPRYDGTLYLADAAKHGEFSPTAHKRLLLEAVAREKPDTIVFSHSSYGWDLAPRVALALNAAQVSEVVDVVDGSLVIPSCNAKLRRNLSSTTAVTVVTLQSGAFGLDDEPAGSPVLEKVDVEATRGPEFAGYEVADKTGVDLTKAQIIVSAGRGIGKAENLEIVALLAAALGGEYGASRPVVDAGWADHNRQVGTTGQSVAPKLYVACGISGAIQHLAGMKKSDFVIAVNTDKDAPIGEVADVLAVADVKQLLPALTERLNSL